jgi:hypothetical protein
MKKSILLTMFIILCSLCIYAQTDTLKVVTSGWDEFKANIFGDKLTLVGYASCYFFTLIGLFLRWRFTTIKAINNNLRTPEKFSLKYWITDNLLPKLLSIMTTGIIIFICLRFAFEWFGYFPSMLFALIIGIGFDWFYDFIKSKMPDVNKAKEAFIKDNMQNTGSPAPK